MMCSGCGKKINISDDFSNVTEEASATETANQDDATVPEYVTFDVTEDDRDTFI